MTVGTRLSGQRSGAEATFQCGQRNSLKTINVDGEHFIRFRGKSCVFKFIQVSVDVAHFLKYLANIEFKIFSLISVIHSFYSNYFVNYALPVILT